MAWAFQLSVECGEREKAEQVASHFDSAILELRDGTTSVCGAGIHQDIEGGWWAIVCPSGVSRSGVSDSNAARQLSEVGSLLYEKLRTAPPFRYAIAGVESEDFRLFSELDSDLIRLSFDGLVIAREIWEKLGCPSIYVPFGTQYFWRPYKGEALPDVDSQRIPN